MRAASKSLLFILIFLLLSSPSWSQVFAWHQGIIETNVDLRGAPVILGQQTINVTEPGNVLVQFDGYCIASPGDRIILAASNGPNWQINDGNIQVEVPNTDINRLPFSHSRVYSVAAGIHTFYAVGENFVEMSGSGIASIYASLTVKFYPHDTENAIVAFNQVSVTNEHVRGAPTVITQKNLSVAVAGKVLVRFDGMCFSDPGDYIVIAASDTPNWGINDGSLSARATDSDINSTPFSHCRLYDVSPGNHTFYGVAQNYMLYGGSGYASFYGSLTLEFFPTVVGGASVRQVGVSQFNVDVSAGTVTMATIPLQLSRWGRVVIRYEGQCESSYGDRIMMAANETPAWGANDGHCSVEAVSASLSSTNFSHTRAFNVWPGTYYFYAVCANWVETAGDGRATNYASFTVEYYPNYIVAVPEEDSPRATFLLGTNFPNPFNPSTTISYDLHQAGFVNLSVFNLQGQNLKTLVNEQQAAGHWTSQWDGKDASGEQMSSGVYLYRLNTAEHQETRKMVLAK